jgi:hypothetical protein
MPVDITAVKGRQNRCSILSPLSTRATLDRVAFIFEEVSISELIVCYIGGTLTTKELTGLMGMNKGGMVATLKITPKEGSTLAIVALTGEKCAIAGLYKVTGTIFAQAKARQAYSPKPKNWKRAKRSRNRRGRQRR